MNADFGEWPRPHRLTVDQYHRMAEVGLLSADARVELIEGEIVDMAPIGGVHAAVVDMLSELLIEQTRRAFIVRTQGPVALSPFSEPQPDIAILKRRADWYRSSAPTPDDVLLIIEVSDATLRFDRGAKAKLYARHGVPEYWVVDLVHRRILVFRNPRKGEYAEESAVVSGKLCAAARPIEIDPAELPW